jgi:hypothetical protein
LEVGVRRPPGARRATVMGPPSANLHKNGPDALEMGRLFYTPKADIGQLRCRLRCRRLLRLEASLYVYNIAQTGRFMR